MEVPVVPSATSVRNVAAPAALSTIDAYLGSPLALKNENATDGGLMAYWIREQSLGLPLAEMALDILTAPGMFFFFFIFFVNSRPVSLTHLVTFSFIC